MSKKLVVAEEVLLHDEAGHLPRYSANKGSTLLVRDDGEVLRIYDEEVLLEWFKIDPNEALCRLLDKIPVRATFSKKCKPEAIIEFAKAELELKWGEHRNIVGDKHRNPTFKELIRYQLDLSDIYIFSSPDLVGIYATEARKKGMAIINPDSILRIRIKP